VKLGFSNEGKKIWLEIFKVLVLSKTLGPHREKAIGSWRKLGNKKLHDLSSSLNVTGTNFKLMVPCVIIHIK
jgi:hypothetical protein